MSESTSETHGGPWGPLLFVALLISAAIWLSSGSSNQAKQSQWTSGWQAQSSFNYPRRAPAAVAYNNYLYMVGGIDGNERYVHTVEYAPIQPDGSLGKWRTTSDLNDGRFYNAAIASNGYLYTLGGGSGETGMNNYPISSVERAKIKNDGSLGPWQPVNNMLSPRRGLKTVLHDDVIYAIGGYDGRFLKSVEQSRILEDGSLTPWQMEQHESIIDRYIHSAAHYKDTIYLLGGHMRDTRQASYRDVEIATIGSKAELSDWQLVPNSLLAPRLVAEAFTLGQYLYIAGGHTGNKRLNSVEVSKLDQLGRPGPWRNTTALPQARSAYAVATWDKHVYVLGGGGEGTPLNSVVMATANHKGELGTRLSQ